MAGKSSPSVSNADASDAGTDDLGTSRLDAGATVQAQRPTEADRLRAIAVAPLFTAGEPFAHRIGPWAQHGMAQIGFWASADPHRGCADDPNAGQAATASTRATRSLTSEPAWRIVSILTP